MSNSQFPPTNLGSSDSAAFTVAGGQFAVAIHATAWSSGSVGLEVLGPDGATYLPVVAAYTADTYATLWLGPGTYKFKVTTATGVYASCLSIPASAPAGFI